jgi:AraC family transcriptional regulator
MPRCCTDVDRVFLFDAGRQSKDLQPKLNTAARNAPLGVLPVHGALELECTPEPDIVHGGLAGWQKRRVAEYIETHLPDRISLTSLAALARLSPYHFSRAFKRSFGTPPHRYHVGRRVEHAKVLLARLPVTDVALAVGYAETSSFSAAFRRATGLSPTQYRRGTPSGKR